MTTRKSSTLRFCEGESLQADELVLYSLLKLTASPLRDPKLSLTTETIPLLKWSAALICQKLSDIFKAVYKEDDLYFYMCLMRQLLKQDNPAMVGFFDGKPRIQIFAPYVDLFVSKCALALSQSIYEETGSLDKLMVVVEARKMSKAVAECSTDMMKDVGTSLVFGALWLKLENFPGWRFENRETELLLWKPYPTKPYQAEKVIRIHEDLTWEIEIPGRKVEKQPELCSSPKDLHQVLTEMDKATICKGLPKSFFKDVLPFVQDGKLYSKDKAKILANENGDFLQSLRCDYLVYPYNYNKRSDVEFVRACISCRDMNEEIRKIGPRKAFLEKTNFETETLNIIARLNVELSERKQQMTQLWEQFSELRQKNHGLEKKVKEMEESGGEGGKKTIVVVADTEWVERQRKQRKEVMGKVRARMMDDDDDDDDDKIEEEDGTLVVDSHSGPVFKRARFEPGSGMGTEKVTHQEEENARVVIIRDKTISR